MLMSDIAIRVRDIINDPDKVRWTDLELIRWASDGEVFITNYRPDAAAITQIVTLVNGTRQTLPTGASHLLDVICAVTGTTNTPAGVLQYIDRFILDSQDPLWHTRPKKMVVKNVVYDDRIPTEFYVYPPAAAGAKVQLSFANKPVPLNALTDVLTVDDMYREMVTNYVLFRCYCKDTEARADRATLYLHALSQALGIKLQKDVAFKPDINNKGGNPDTAAAAGGGV